MIQATLQEAHRLQKSGDLAESEKLCRQALDLDPTSADALHLLGLACRKAEKLDDALAAFLQASQIQPGNPIYAFELGIIYSQRAEPEPALEQYRRAMALKPDFQEAYVNGGATLADMGRHEEAIPWYQKSLQLNPRCAGTYLNLGNAWQELARFDLAVQCYDRAIELEPDNARAHWNRSMANLRNGNFAQGWEGYEWRVPSGETKLDVYPYPLWDGSPLAGKRLLVHGEQGIGDEILFASCYHDLIEQGAHCILVCEPRLETLFRRSFPQTSVVAHRRKKDSLAEIKEPVDLSVAAGSLPRFLRTSVESFPQRNCFLTADPKLTQLWKERFAAMGPGLKIGISWRAGGKPTEQIKRTTDLRIWRGIFAVPGTQFINLQYGQCDEDLAYARDALGVTIHDWPDADALTDLDNLAAQMCSLDLVLAVVNTTVHLAGALGVPAWGLLPATPSWRWMEQVEQVPWYSSVRLFRQQRGESWKPAFDRVRRELCRLAGVEDTSIDAAWHEVAVSAGGAALPGEEQQYAPRMPGHMTASSFGTKVNQLVEQAVAVHKNGNLAEAEKLYREVLKHAPQHADALHLLGVIQQQHGRPQQAIKLIQQAIRMVDTVANFHYHLGLSQKELGRAEEAMASYRRAIQLNPEFVEPQLNLGVALQSQGRLDEAIECYRQALAIKPEVAGLHYNLGGAYWKTGRHDDSLREFETALQLQPQFPEALLQVGQIHRESGKLDEAIACYDQAIQLNPNYAPAHVCLGRAYHDQHRYDEAILSYQQALALRPQCFESLAQLGSAFHEQGQYRLAEDCYCRALAIKDDAKVRLNLAAALRHTGQLDLALGVVGKVLARDPEHAEAHVARALIWLQQGNFREGFSELDWRWRTPRNVRPRQLSAAEWDGTPLAGRTILIHGEGNLDDEILFASCLPDMVDRIKPRPLVAPASLESVPGIGATNGRGFIGIACDPRLVPLLQRSFPTAEIEPLDPKLSTPWTPSGNHDVQIPLGNLPRHLRPLLESFPAQEAYLQADDEATRSWRSRFEALGPGLKIGIAWHGNSAAAPLDQVPAWDHWKRLLTSGNSQFVSLHGGVHRADVERAVAHWDAPLHVPLESDSLADLDKLAAQIAALDLVITVDNSIAHLAGALGTPVWTILPHAWGWQWLLHRDDSPWYRSMRLFRTPRPGALRAVFERVAQELAVLGNAAKTQACGKLALTTHHSRLTTHDSPLTTHH